MLLFVTHSIWAPISLVIAERECSLTLNRKLYYCRALLPSALPHPWFHPHHQRSVVNNYGSFPLFSPFPPSFLCCGCSAEDGAAGSPAAVTCVRSDCRRRLQGCHHHPHHQMDLHTNATGGQVPEAVLTKPCWGTCNPLSWSSLATSCLWMVSCSWMKSSVIF